jgi:23S rRNA (pseudouridine1915-N3)-methyltransferase
MSIKIITIGNKPSPEIQAIITDYTRRLPRNISVTWVIQKHSDGDVKSSKQQESENILRAINDKDFVILLDETGKQLSSEELSKTIFTSNSDIVFIIGGAYGVTKSVFERAQLVWSLSKLVFPHQLVRVILSEQIYRAYTISIGHPYHHS